MDAITNFAYSTVAVAPYPPGSGTTLTVQPGEGVRFPAPPFNAPVWAADDQPLFANAEIVRVTSIAGDVLTFLRTQESADGAPATPRTILVGDQIAAPFTAKLVRDLAADIAAKAPLVSPALTGTPTAPTPGAADASTTLATTAFVAGAVATRAPLASPAFTGTPTAPTAGAGTNTTQLATTAFVGAAVAAGGGGSAAPVTQTISLTGTQHNVALTAACTLLRCTNASLLTITGLAAGVDGQRLTILSEGAGHVALTPELAGTGSTAANRLTNTVTKGDTMLAAGVGSATYIYSATRARWKLHTHEQGAAIGVPYNAGDFTSNTGSWTVDAGDVSQFNYYLQGKRLTIQIYLNQTSITGTPTNLRIALPNGYVCGNTSLVGNLEYLNNAAWTDSGHFEFTINNTYVVLWTIYQSTWASATNNCWMQGSASCDLQ